VIFDENNPDFQRSFKVKEKQIMSLAVIKKFIMRRGRC
jgi:hypothetical protein